MSQNSVKVTPELMQRLVDGGKKKPQRRRRSLGKLDPVSPISPLPIQDKRLEKHQQDAQQAPSVGAWPAFSPFVGAQAPFGGLFGGQPVVESTVEPNSNVKAELAPVYKAIEESEGIAQKLRNQGDHELEKVKKMAQELQEKQYRAPSHAPPCTNERQNCIDCYRQNHKNPLLCSKLVQAFVACSRQAQEEFMASVLS